MSINSFFDSVRSDLRHALRGLQRRPMFALAAALTIALGIGVEVRGMNDLELGNVRSEMLGDQAEAMTSLWR